MEFWLLSFQFYLRFCSPEKLIYEKELIEALSTIFCVNRKLREESRGFLFTQYDGESLFQLLVFRTWFIRAYP